ARRCEDDQARGERDGRRGKRRGGRGRPGRASTRGAERLTEDESENAGRGGRPHGHRERERACPPPRTMEDEGMRQRLGLGSPQGERERAELGGDCVARGAVAAVRVEEDGLELRELAVERDRRGLARAVAIARW